MLRRFAPACKSTILIRVKARSLMGSVIVAFIIQPGIRSLKISFQLNRNAP